MKEQQWLGRMALLVIGVWLMGVEVVEKTLQIPRAEPRGTQELAVDLTFPEFQGEAHPETLQALNQAIVEANDTQCQDFYGQQKLHGPGQLTSEYEVRFVSEAFISVAVTYQFDFSDANPDAEDPTEVWFEVDRYWNLDLKEGRFLNVEDCFEFVGDEQAWTEFVVNGDQEAANYALPDAFLADADGVVFQYASTELPAVFLWEELDGFFTVQSLEEVRKGE